MNENRTKQRILDVAEQMFADHGFAATSVRRIISAAGVNLAAVHYYFHSKDALLEAVLVRRLEPLNRERLALLDQCEAQAGRKPPRVDAILTAFIEPPMRLILNSSGEGRLFGKLIGRLYSETGAFFAEIAKRHFGVIGQRFGAAFGRALPQVPIDEQYWRMHCAIGVMAHTLRCWDQLEPMSQGQLKTDDVDTAIRRIVHFLAAGFKAPVARAGMKPRTRRSARSEKR